MRELALEVLTDHNKNMETPITRLCYNDNGDYVEDFSALVNKGVINKETLLMLQNTKELTLGQKKEKSRYLIIGDLGDLTRKYLNTELQEFVWNSPISREREKENLSLSKVLPNEHEKMDVCKVEKEILKLSAQCWNSFVSLSQTHPNDIDEFTEAIHQIQKLIAVRLCRRTHPDIFLTK